MKIIDPGHEYDLHSLDGEFEQRLRFVKREGPHYPGNIGHHPGTTMQEVLRALIERAAYVNRQIPCAETELVVGHLRSAIYILEARAARVHGRIMVATVDDVVNGTGICDACGHIGCQGNCRVRGIQEPCYPPKK